MALTIKIRLSRKVIIALSASLVLFGATGAAAIFIGKEALLGPSEESISGVECVDVIRIADVRNRELPWLRKYIRTESTDGLTRLKTALRVAKLMQEHLPAELIHIAVLDENGPEIRAEMRGRAIGAEVFLFNEHVELPGVDELYQGRYYEGTASETGIFYGDEHRLSADELVALAAPMEELADCTPLKGEPELASGGHAVAPSADGHGGGEAESAVEGHGEASTEGDHGATAEEPGFIGKMLNLVGLGPSGSAEDHAGNADEHAPVVGHGEPTEHGDGIAAASDGEHSEHGEIVTNVLDGTDHDGLAEAAVHAASESSNGDGPETDAHESDEEIDLSEAVAEEPEHEDAATQAAGGWDGGHDGEIVIFDGPSDKMMLEWQDDTLDEPMAAEEVAPALDHAPVSSVTGDHAPVADH